MIHDGKGGKSPPAAVRVTVACCQPARGLTGLAPDGLKFAIFFTKVHDRILRPLMAGDEPQAPPPLCLVLLAIDVSLSGGKAKQGSLAARIPRTGRGSYLRNVIVGIKQAKSVMRTSHRHVAGLRRCTSAAKFCISIKEGIPPAVDHVLS